MSQPSIISKIREWFGGKAFRVFLWSIRMTQDEYLNTIVSESIDYRYSVYMHCWECHMWGTPMPKNTDTCGNCGGHDVTIYYPSIQGDGYINARYVCLS